jgi:hypothetical protein
MRRFSSSGVMRAIRNFRKKCRFCHFHKMQPPSVINSSANNPPPRNRSEASTRSSSLLSTKPLAM